MNHIGHIFSHDESYNMPHQSQPSAQEPPQEPTFSLVFEAPENKEKKSSIQTKKTSSSVKPQTNKRKAIHYLVKNMSVMKKQLSQMERVLVYLIQEEQKTEQKEKHIPVPKDITPTYTSKKPQHPPTETKKQKKSQLSQPVVKTLEGVFNGQHMIGSDGAEYAIPPNYASKSKLVEGDLLKLNIQQNGFHVYKQIGPIERMRTQALLAYNEEQDTWQAYTKDRAYTLLSEAVRFHKGNPGDEILIIVPQDGNSDWAALEGIEKE